MYSHPVYSMHLDISPSGLLILFLPALFSVYVCPYTLFLSALYSVSLGSYSVSVVSFTRFPYSSTHFLYGNAPFVLHPEKYHPSFALPLSPPPFRSPFPVSRCAPFFSVLPYLFHCALPSSFLPCSPLPHPVINRVLLPIPVLVGRLKAQ